MDMLLSDVQEALRDTARRWLKSRTGWQDEWWPLLRQLGWLDDGLGTVEHTVLAEQAGAALLGGPWLVTAALAGPLRLGTGPATLAWAEPAPGAATLRDAVSEVQCRAENGRLYGHKRLVPQPGGLVVVVAQTPAGPALYGADSCAARVRSTLDASRPVADLDFAGTPARLLLGADETPDMLRLIRHHALAVLAGEGIGVAQRALDIAVAYARTRTQFGRPIGTYQAVSHRLAAAAVRIELARSLAYRAAWCVQARTADAGDAVLAATVASRGAALESCESAIQTLGGIGFQWDHPLHLFYRRARWIATFDGATSDYRAECAALLIDAA